MTPLTPSIQIPPASSIHNQSTEIPHRSLGPKASILIPTHGPLSNFWLVSYSGPFMVSSGLFQKSVHQPPAPNQGYCFTVLHKAPQMLSWKKKKTKMIWFGTGINTMNQSSSLLKTKFSLSLGLHDLPPADSSGLVLFHVLISNASQLCSTNASPCNSPCYFVPASINDSLCLECHS